MQNSNLWKPSKFVIRSGRLVASKDLAEVSVSSRLNADIVAAHYDKYLRRYARGRLLDLGCGKVPLFASYRQYIVENVCVDWENSSHKNPYLDIECDLTKKLPFTNEEFDTILLSDVLEHIPTPEHLWKEMHRVLAPKGVLIMNVPFFYQLHEQPYDYYRYTEFALRRFISESCMTELVLVPMGGVPEILGDLLAKILAKKPMLGTALARAVQGITATFVATDIGRKVSENTARRFPLGYFLVAEK